MRGFSSSFFYPNGGRLSALVALALLLLGCVNVPILAANKLFDKGKSKYKIVLAPSASTSEKTAAGELRQYIKEISGAELAIVNDLNCSGARIFVGYNSRVEQLIGRKNIKDDDESYTYLSKGKDLFIYGGKQRGTMYGVYAFLENELGCRWYTPSFSKIPKQDKWSFKTLNHSESPALKYRYSNYYSVADDDAWSAHNKENMKWTARATEYGNLEAYWSAHTMGQFVSEKEYFDTHPEYFAMKEGKRIKRGQLCLSNPEVLRICTEGLLKVMEEKPLYRIYSLSQNDNFGFCECDECKKIEAQYGGHSGIILWFVNQAADAAKKLFPNKYVGTFAYQYGRKPPVGIVPRDNVVIRLCSIECCFGHPLEANCPQNKAFMEDLKGWSKIAPHLFIWDYIVNYAQYVAPWPNFQVLGPNIQTFKDNNAIGVFEEAMYQRGGACEFSDMKAWVVTKLLWNPKQDVNVLVKDFIDGYYGKSAGKIWEYYQLCQSLVVPDKHYGIYIRSDDPIYSDEFVMKGEALLNEAVRLAENNNVKDRAEEVRFQILYLKFTRNKERSFKDGTWDELKRLMEKFDVRVGKGYEGKSFINDNENYKKKLEAAQN